MNLRASRDRLEPISGSKHKTQGVWTGQDVKDFIRTPMLDFNRNRLRGNKLFLCYFKALGITSHRVLGFSLSSRKFAMPPMDSAGTWNSGYSAAATRS